MSEHQKEETKLEKAARENKEKQQKLADERKKANERVSQSYNLKKGK